MTNLYAELKRRLSQGFYPDNLRTVAILCEEASWQADNLVGLFLISHIFWWLDDYWRERPMTSEAAKRMKEIIEPPIIRYFDDAASGLAPQDELSRLNEMARSFLQWRHELDDAPAGED